MSYDQIAHEAVRLFSEKTYPAVGMRDISDAVGLLPGSLYAHIGSKEDLLMRIVERGIMSYIDALSPLNQSTASASDRIREATSIYMHTLDSRVELTRVSVFQWRYLNEPNRTHIIELRNRYAQIFHKIIDDGIKSGEFRKAANPKVSTYAIMGLLNSIMHWYSPTGDLEEREISGELADLILRGL